MSFASDPVGNFIDAHPSLKILALAFLILVGMALIADGLDYHIPRGYLYFAMAFSGVVEALNIAARSEEHTSELQSLMRISYAVFCLKKNNIIYTDATLLRDHSH